MPIDLDTLNDNQRQAVMWEDGPLLVLAGPGSGKTRVLTSRVARLLEEREDTSVLALTFTNKAAAEMRERVDGLLGQRADRAHLCTFHSFATDVLRQHGSHLGLRPDFTLLTQEDDRLALLAPVVADMQQSGQAVSTDLKSLLRLLDRLFGESYGGGPEAPGLALTPGWLPALFNGYQAALIAANRLDFGSLLGFTRRLLAQNKGVARVIRLGWTHVCVDEFQDTNKAQYDVLKLIVPQRAPNLFVVADDDQIIYQWNGASPERLQALRADYDMPVIQLPENYRCPPRIIEMANTLIEHNRLRTPGKKPLTAHRSASLADDVIRYGVYDSPEQEMEAVADDICSRDVEPADCVVLGRTTRLLESAARALQAAGLEAYVARRKNEFEHPLVRIVYQALRLANLRHDHDELRRLCLAWEALSGESLEVEDVVANSALMGGDFLRAWASAAAATTDEMLSGLLSRLQASLVDRLDFPAIVDWFLSEGNKPWLDEQDAELKEELETWRELHGQIGREFAPDDLTLNVYLQQMDLASKAALPPPDAVRCMTVHGSKGLEFKHVYLVGMAQQVLPSFQALKKGQRSKEVEEERRNCFVAITRVQETLTLTRSKTYFGWRKPPSQFIAEMGLKP